MVEDNAGDVELLREALQEHAVACNLSTVNDGEKALAMIKRFEAGDVPCPDLFVLDLNLPKVDGRKVLEHIRAGERCSRVPVVVLSSSDAPADIRAAMRVGASRYIRKPSNLDEFMEIGAVLKKMLG